MVASYAKWFQRVPWQVFGTFTFPGRVSDVQAVEVFDAFVNKLERHQRADVGYLRGDEKRFSGLGKPACPRHFHAVMTCASRLETGAVEGLWTAVVGHVSPDMSALVLPYEPSLNGVKYVLKTINHPDGDWSARNLELFLPEQDQHMMGSTARSRRHFRRHQSRAHLRNVEAMQ